MNTEDTLTYFETQSHLITIPVPTNTNPKHLETNISQSSCSTNPPKTTPKHNPPQKSDHRNKFIAPNYNPHTQNTNTWLIKLQKHPQKIDSYKGTNKCEQSLLTHPPSQVTADHHNPFPPNWPNSPICAKHQVSSYSTPYHLCGTLLTKSQNLKISTV